MQHFIGNLKEDMYRNMKRCILCTLACAGSHTYVALYQVNYSYLLNQQVFLKFNLSMYIATYIHTYVHNDCFNFIGQTELMTQYF